MYVLDNYSMSLLVTSFGFFFDNDRFLKNKKTFIFEYYLRKTKLILYFSKNILN